MNRVQKRILIGSAAAILLMLLFPPWSYSLSLKTGPTIRATAGGYSFLGSPPKPYGGWGTVRLDLQRLLVQLAAVATVAGAALVLTKDLDR